TIGSGLRNGVRPESGNRLNNRTNEPGMNRGVRPTIDRNTPNTRMSENRRSFTPERDGQRNEVRMNDNIHRDTRIQERNRNMDYNRSRQDRNFNGAQPSRVQQERSSMPQRNFDRPNNNFQRSQPSFQRSEPMRS